jgi:hypothetical protein
MFDVRKISDKVVALHVIVMNLTYQPKHVDNKGRIVPQMLYIRVASRISRKDYHFSMRGKMADTNAFHLHVGKMVSIIADPHPDNILTENGFERVYAMRAIIYGPDSDAVQSQRPKDWNVWGSEGNKEFARQLKDTHIRIETGYQGSSEFGNATVQKPL